MIGDAVLAAGIVGVGALALSGSGARAASAPAAPAPAPDATPWAVNLPASTGDTGDTSSGVDPWAPYTPQLVFDSAPVYDDTIAFSAPIEYPYFEPPEVETVIPPVQEPAAAAVNSARNLDAFLAIIRAGESSDNYTALVGGGNFTSFTDHPAITGEFMGITRGDDGRLTTAAGAYQITRTTWKSLGGIAKYGSFAPSAQDRAAVDLLKRRKAYDDVVAGRIEEAIRKLPQEWEMFTLARWRGERALAAYKAEGGAVA